MAFLGDLGSAKTTLCTRYLILTKKLHPEKKIYCNYTLYNYPFELLDLMDLYLNHQNEKNIIVVADELYTMMDSRVATSYRNRIESYFVAMTRKKDADFFVTMQYEKFVDCRLAPFIKVKYIMEKIMQRHILYIDNIKYTYLKPHPYLFKCTLFDERDNNHPICKEFIFNGLRWFPEFNTDEVILPPEDVLLNIKLNKLKKEVQYTKLLNKKKELENNEKQTIN